MQRLSCSSCHIASGVSAPTRANAHSSVCRLTIANQMLSLVGSIQPDPFSPEHVPQATVTTASAAATSRSVSEREVDALMAESEGEESDEDMDPFQKLGKMADEEAQRAREAQEETRKEKKRKRKEGKGQGDATSTGEKKSKKKKTADVPELTQEQIAEAEALATVSARLSTSLMIEDNKVLVG